MREIKFRALKDDMADCRFVYGCLVYNNEGEPRIQKDSTHLFITCISGTEGQYTGLKDKNGKEIYEGDIVKCMLDFGPAGEHERILQVYITPFGCPPMMEWNYKENMLPEVIGNIYENKELLNK